MLSFLVLFCYPVGGIPYQIGGIFQIQLGTDVVAMRFDCFNAAAKQVGDLPTTMSGSD
jgi:hypothetical protein